MMRFGVQAQLSREWPWYRGDTCRFLGQCSLSRQVLGKSCRSGPGDGVRRRSSSSPFSIAVSM